MSYGGHPSRPSQGSPHASYGSQQDPYYDPAGPQTPGADSYPPYASTDHFAQSDFVGRDIAGQRNNSSYPPKGGEYYEKGLNPVTRGSIAAQMAAEGQIPKKEGLRMWRSDEHAGALMRGGKGRCCGRVCCCSIILVLIILVSIIASFFLWVRPPDISFNGIEAPSNGSEVSVQSNGFLLNFQLNIGVINPNFFGANFGRIKATAFYPTDPSTAFGGGSLSNVDIPKNSNTTIHFPFSVNYTTSLDPDLSILKDIATKCGFLGSSASQLTVDYTLVLSLKVVAITISPSFSSSASFDCPLSESDVTGLLGSGGLGALTGSSRVMMTRRELQEEAERAMAKVMKRGWQELWERDGRWTKDRATR